MDPLLYPNVHLGDGSHVDVHSVIGQPPRGRAPGELATVMGAGCTIRSHTVIYAGNRIGDNFQTGHFVMVREDNEIGANVSVGTGTVIEHHVVIEDGVRIHSQAFVPEYSVLESGCWIGPNVVLTNAKYPNRPDTKDHLEGPRIGRGAVIGANSTLLPGVHIGASAIVGAGSVVAHDVPEGAVVYGNPATVHAKTEE